jgi:hypothetical protein
LTEPTVASALSGRRQQGGRTLRRQVLEITGLDRQQIAGIARARAAFKLLSEGVGTGDVVDMADASKPRKADQVRRPAPGYS